MALHNPRRQRVTAATFARVSASLLAAGALWGGQRLRGAALDTTQDVLEAAFACVATLCLARLSWVCLAAARDLLESDTVGRAAQRTAGSSPAEEERRSQGGRARAASLFLALAALVATSAGGATAAPKSFAATSSLPSPDFELSPAPDFALPPTNPSPPPTGHSSAPGASEDTGARAPNSTCPTPVPGWTPVTHVPDTDACRLLMPGNRTEHAHEHVVLRGQNLWSIAAAHLPPDAPTEAVASAVHEWVAANPALAEHPDLIQPGDVLRVPAAEPTVVTR